MTHFPTDLTALRAADLNDSAEQFGAELARPQTRRGFLARTGLAALGLMVGRSALAQTSKAPAWAEGMELDVNFVLKTPAGRYNRPYAAVWIEDASGASVRTLGLWANTTPKSVKYLNELRRWSRGDQARRAQGGGDVVTTVSSPTRVPGAFNVVWDGRDDRKALLPQGNYTLVVEAAREDGPYGRVRQELALGGAPLKKTPEGAGEITDVVAEYRRR
ncbi:DUF2271 domain-containing protein [Deinococcus sp. UYEF24]